MTTPRRSTTIVLAAGWSSRTGASNKLFFPIGTSTVLETVVSKALSSGAETIVVTGHESERVATLLSPYDVRVVQNNRFETGMASSIVCGVRHAIESDSYLIWPGDMPLIRPETVQVVRDRATDGKVVVPSFEGRRGHPVLFANAFRNDLLSLTGDVGARAILHDRAQVVDEIPVSDAGILFDVDTPEAYDELLRRLSASPND
ncbi:MAG: nucleotidyltransferase family protein [Rhodothermales bacterium]|nr:nucleotidyltransferase family protein [Rhodothermales bacterium]